MATPKAQINLVADTSGFDANVAKANNALNATTRNMEKTASRLDGLNQQFGEQSGLKKYTELLYGAGAVAGIAIILRGLDQIIDRTRAFTDAVRRGEKAWDDLAGEIIDSIPLISSAVNVVESVFNAALGPRGGQRELDQQRYGLLREMSRELEGQVELAALGEGTARRRLEIEKELERTLAEIEKLRRGAIAVGGDRENANNQAAALEKQARELARLKLLQEDLNSTVAAGPDVVQQMTIALQDQLDALRLTSEELLVQKLRREGVSQANIEYLVGLQRAIEAEKEAQRAAAEAAAALKSQQQALESRAAAIIEATRTPLERYRATIEELQDLLSRGLIDEETLARATAAAEEQLDALQKKAATIGVSFESFEAAFSRIANAAASSGNDAGSRTARASEITNDRLREMIEQGKIFVSSTTAGLRAVQEAVAAQDGTARLGR